MANFTWAASDPKAETIVLYYEGTNTVREGMALHYNHDTTANWSGVDRADGSRSTTTTEGSQNEGKWIRVEEPSNANRRFFAGVVASGSAGAGAAGPSQVDVYIPNGALVPVYTDRNVTINDGAYVELGANTVINSGAGNGPQIGFFAETIDRSTNAGLALIRLCEPDMSEQAAATTLGVGLSPLLWGDAPSAVELADPGAGISYFDDFLGDHNPTTAEGWAITATTSGTLGLVAAVGGELKLDTAGNVTADDGLEAQLINCRFLPAAGTNIWFEARVKMNDATDQYFVGLAATDTSLLPAGVADDAVDKCGFYHLAASTDNKISSITARTSADDLTADVADNADGTYMTVGFKITGITTVDFYVNGVVVESGAATANVPNAAMCLSLVSKIEVAGADAELSVDWVKIAQDVARA